MTSVAERPAARTLQVPPHSVEAEESVLGAVLLSAEATNIALEKLHGEDFYRPAHQQVFEAVQRLFDENEPIDAVTVSEVLRRDGSLELMGGIDFLTRLLDAVPTTSNIEYYADIVEEHALRRRLIRVAGTIGSIAGEMQEPIADVLDRSEQEIFLVSERRVGDGLASIDPLLVPAIEKAEELVQRSFQYQKDFPVGWAQLVEIYMVQERWDSALEACDRTLECRYLEASGLEGPIHARRGQIYIKQERIDEALVELEKPLELGKHNNIARHLIALHGFGRLPKQELEK
ncbi:MAG: hypothetical protein IH942_05905, partial [Acidobacteria bacterium]|nr:hypothetical protein [Acidobacteriota bacterium]